MTTELVEEELPVVLSAEQVKKQEQQLINTELAYKDTLNSYHQLQHDYSLLKQQFDQVSGELASRLAGNASNEEYFNSVIENTYFKVPKVTYLDHLRIMVDHVDDPASECFYLTFDKNLNYQRAYTDTEIEKKEKEL
jgi:hypothetical protein